MKRILLFAFLSACGFLNAQDLTFSHIDTLLLTENVGARPELDDFVAHSNIKNRSSEPLKIQWIAEHISGHPDWQRAVCDKNQCYPYFILSNIDSSRMLDKPVDLEAKEEGVIDVHIYPNGGIGSGFSRVCFFNIEDASADYGCMLYKFTIQESSSTVEKFDASVKLFPNPTADYFTIEGLEQTQQVRILNAAGQEVRAFEGFAAQQYFIGDMPAGNYIVALLNEEGAIARTGILQKAN